MKFGNVLTIIVGSLMMHCTLSYAAVTINVSEVGGDVVASASGTINTAGLGAPQLSLESISYINGTKSFGFSKIMVGSAPSGSVSEAYNIDGPVDLFATEDRFIATSASGEKVGVYSSPINPNFISVPQGYVSNTPISGTATWSGQTFAGLGLVTGVHVFTWGSGDTADTLTLNIGAAPPSTYTVGGDVTGLAGSGLVLQNNAGDDLAVSADGSFTFATALVDLSSYVVTVLTDPTSPNQTCTVTNDTGTLAGANVTNVAVTCVTDVVPTYTVGGNVTGLAGSGLVLQNNAGDDLAVSADGSFTFATALVDLSSYVVTVLTQPTSPNQTCNVTNGTGTLAGANVTNVSVACALDPKDQTITIFTATPSSGAVGGSSTLSASASSGLTVTYGSNTLTICTVSGSTVSYLAIGTCTVTADQAGDANYNPAPQVTLDINVTATPPAKPNVPIPTLSPWGLVAMFLMMLAIAGMIVRRRTRG